MPFVKQIVNIEIENIDMLKVNFLFLCLLKY